MFYWSVLHTDENESSVKRPQKRRSSNIIQAEKQDVRCEM